MRLFEVHALRISSFEALVEDAMDMAGVGICRKDWAIVLSSTPSEEQFTAFRHGGWAKEWLKYLAPSRGTASTGKAYKNFLASTSRAFNSHWQSYTNPSTRSFVPLGSSRIHCTSLKALHEVVRPLLHRIGRKAEE